MFLACICLVRLGRRTRGTGLSFFPRREEGAGSDGRDVVCGSGGEWDRRAAAAAGAKGDEEEGNKEEKKEKDTRTKRKKGGN